MKYISYPNIEKYFSMYPTYMYTVMQSDRNTFYGDVVMDSCNKTSRNEDNILDQIYQIQIFSDLYYEDLKFLEFLKKMYI